MPQGRSRTFGAVLVVGEHLLERWDVNPSPPLPDQRLDPSQPRRRVLPGALLGVVLRQLRRDEVVGVQRRVGALRVRRDAVLPNLAATDVALAVAEA